MKSLIMITRGLSTCFSRFLAQNSVFYELFSYLEEKYFRVEFRIYEHVALGPNAGTYAQLMIVGIALGLILASIFTAYTRIQLGDFVRRMLSENAIDKESAKTLSELSSFRNSAVRHALSHSVTLRKFVKCAEEETFHALSPEEKAANQTTPVGFLKILHAVKVFFAGREVSYHIDYTKDHFYIPGELCDRAEVRFERRGSGWWGVALTVILVIVFSSLLCTFLPDLVQLMDNLIGMMAP